MSPDASETKPCGPESGVRTLKSFHSCVSGLNRAMCPDSCSVNQMLPFGSTAESCGTAPGTGASQACITPFSSTPAAMEGVLNVNRSVTFVSLPGRTKTLCSHSDHVPFADARKSYEPV